MTKCVEPDGYNLAYRSKEGRVEWNRVVESGVVKKVRENVIDRQISDYCRGRLLQYSKGFASLAGSYGREFCPEDRELRSDILMERRLWENGQSIKGHFNEISNILKNVAGEVQNWKPMDLRSAGALQSRLRREGIRVNPPIYLDKKEGRKALVIQMKTVGRKKYASEDVTDMISVILNQRLQLSYESPLTVDSRPQSYVLEEEPEYTTFTGFAKAVKEGEKCSGDNYGVYAEEAGRLVVMLSDGTGAGTYAAEASNRVLETMEKLMEAGYGSEEAINLVNSLFYFQGEDGNHPTLDICDIDLYKGNCTFRKIGGAATFLKRDETVSVLRDPSLPLGVFREADCKPILSSLRSGDYLIMMTDGVADVFGGEDYEAALSELIKDMKERNPGEMAEKILRAALIRGGGRILDDMTVGVVGLWRNG